MDSQQTFGIGGWSFAASANQSSQLQSIMMNDLVIGNGNRAPKLFTLIDFSDWKDRIQTHIEGMEGGIWEAVMKKYVRPIDEITRIPVAYEDLTEP